MARGFDKISDLSDWHKHNRCCPVCLGRSADTRILCVEHDAEWMTRDMTQPRNLIEFINDKIIPVLAASEWIADE